MCWQIEDKVGHSQAGALEVDLGGKYRHTILMEDHSIISQNYREICVLSFKNNYQNTRSSKMSIIIQLSIIIHGGLVSAILVNSRSTEI